MKFRFNTNEHQPDRMAARCEIVFEKGDDLTGLRLNDVALWHGKDGNTWVSFPSRKGKDGSGKDKYFDYLGPNGKNGIPAIKALKAKVLDAWEQQDQRDADDMKDSAVHDGGRPDDSDLPF